MTSIWEDQTKAVDPEGGFKIHDIINRSTFAVVEAAIPQAAAFSDLKSPCPTLRAGRPLPVGVEGTTQMAYLAVGTAHPYSLWPPVDGDSDFLVVTPIEPKAQFAFYRSFFALIREKGSLQPYGLSKFCVYYFHEFRSTGATERARREQWLANIDKAVEKLLGARAGKRQKESQADDKVLDDITPARLAHMKEVINKLKMSNSSASFRAPGSFAALGFRTFPEIIKEPMDLGTIEMKLKNKEYQTTEKFMSDFHLIVNNCYMTWGRDCLPSKNAAIMQALFETQMKMLPALGLLEPPTTLTEAGAEKAATACKGSRSTYIGNPLTEPATRQRSVVGIIKIGDDGVIEALPTDQIPTEQGAQLPSHKRRRLKSGEPAEFKVEEIRKRLETFEAAEEERSKDLLALINKAASPHTLQAMNDMYEHSFGTEDTRATAAFAQALQEVTAAIGSAKKERFAMLKEISKSIGGLEEL